MSRISCLPRLQWAVIPAHSEFDIITGADFVSFTKIINCGVWTRCRLYLSCNENVQETATELILQPEQVPHINKWQGTTMSCFRLHRLSAAAAGFIFWCRVRRHNKSKSHIYCEIILSQSLSLSYWQRFSIGIINVSDPPRALSNQVLRDWEGKWQSGKRRTKNSAFNKP